MQGIKLNTESSKFGQDILFPDDMVIDESRMMMRVKFCDGNKKDGVGDVLEVGGIRTERHRINPIVLFDHGKKITLPIALAEDPKNKAYTVELDPISKTGHANSFFYQGTGSLKSSSGFSEADHALFCEQLFDLAAKRYIRAGSIGYQVVQAVRIPPDYSTGSPEGLHLISVVMLELSLVVLPANQDTVVKVLSMPSVCGKRLSPYLVKSLAPYAPERIAVMGPQGKAVDAMQAVEDRERNAERRVHRDSSPPEESHVEFGNALRKRGKESGKPDFYEVEEVTPVRNRLAHEDPVEEERIVREQHEATFSPPKDKKAMSAEEAEKVVMGPKGPLSEEEITSRQQRFIERNGAETLAALRRPGGESVPRTAASKRSAEIDKKSLKAHRIKSLRKKYLKKGNQEEQEPTWQEEAIASYANAGNSPHSSGVPRQMDRDRIRDLEETGSTGYPQIDDAFIRRHANRRQNPAPSQKALGDHPDHRKLAAENDLRVLNAKKQRNSARAEEGREDVQAEQRQKEQAQQKRIKSLRARYSKAQPLTEEEFVERERAKYGDGREVAVSELASGNRHFSNAYELRNNGGRSGFRPDNPMSEADDEILRGRWVRHEHPDDLQEKRLQKIKSLRTKYSSRGVLNAPQEKRPLQIDGRKISERMAKEVESHPLKALQGVEDNVHEFQANRELGQILGHDAEFLADQGDMRAAGEAEEARKHNQASVQAGRRARDARVEELKNSHPLKGMKSEELPDNRHSNQNPEDEMQANLAGIGRILSPNYDAEQEPAHDKRTRELLKLPPRN